MTDLSRYTLNSDIDLVHASSTMGNSWEELATNYKNICKERNKLAITNASLKRVLQDNPNVKEIMRLKREIIKLKKENNILLLDNAHMSDYIADQL